MTLALVVVTFSYATPFSWFVDAGIVTLLVQLDGLAAGGSIPPNERGDAPTCRDCRRRWGQIRPAEAGETSSK